MTTEVKFLINIQTILRLTNKRFGWVQNSIKTVCNPQQGIRLNSQTSIN